ncbi:restriction endonuclease subunit S [Dyadobacter sp. CY347]|uniref:restriction endonuclease subunit S n=1 Tax=Dyadobacter sp. CY347 TaxID=2909336 RepID=UPI001F30030C|nr:restriction endonuclease subunit S [Dyadobacter sp. CY347]MCF2489693.1 restriction endonuclease subunit S [Dyadobacter sp. CY347]
MKQDWETKRLDDVCNVEYGTRVVSKRDGGTVYPVYGGGGATFFKDTFNREDCFIVARFAMSQQCTRFVQGKFFLNDSGLSVKPKNQKEILQEFLNLQLLYLNDNIYSLARGTAQKNLDLSAFRNIKIYYPKSLSEQLRIVSILDEAFAAITQAKANAEQNLKNTKELFESYLQGVFEEKGEGWEEKTLKEISLEFARGKSKHRPRGDASLLDGEYPLIQTGDVSNSDHWINSYSQTYNEKGLAQSKLWPKGTVCIAIVGSNVAETAILNFEACFPDSVIGIVVNPKKANNEYVDYLLQFFKAYLKEKGKGTARDNINLATFEFQKFPFPNVETQIQIVSRFHLLSTETKRLESIYKKKIADLEDLKKSLLEKAFKGELVLETESV